MIQLAYYNKLDFSKWFPGSLAFIGITAATGIHATKYNLLSWKIRTVEAQANSGSKAVLTSPSTVVSASVEFEVDIIITDGCGNVFTPIEGINTKDDITLVAGADDCTVRDTQLLSFTTSSYRVKMSCTAIGSKSLTFAYKQSNIPALAINVLPGVFIRAALNFMWGTKGNIDSGIQFLFVPWDINRNVAEATEDQVKAKLQIKYPEAANTRGVYTIEKKTDKTFLIKFSSDEKGIYSIKDEAFIIAQANGQYDFELEEGAFSAINSEAKLFEGAVEADGQGTWPLAKLASYAAGNDLTIQLIYRDRVGNDISTSKTDEAQAVSELLINGLARSLKPMDVGARNYYKKIKLDQSGKDSFNFKYLGQQIVCRNCNFDVISREANFESSALYQYDSVNKRYSTEAKKEFSLNKADAFNFKFLVQDLYGNLVPLSNLKAYGATLSGNFMREIALSSALSESGIKLGVSNEDLELYNNLVGTSGYVITVFEASTNKLKTWNLTIVSDGSDKNYGNGELDIKQTTLAWVSGGTVLIAGKNARASITLKTKQGKIYNGWINETAIEASMSIAFVSNLGEVLGNPKKADKRGVYFVDFTPIVARQAANNLKLKVNGEIVPRSLAFKVNPNEAFKAIINAPHIKANSSSELLDGTISKEYLFTLKIFDQYNNLQDPVTHSLAIKSLEDATVQLAVTSVKSALGEYTCRITTTFPGKYNLDSNFIKNGAPNGYSVYFRRGSPSAKTSIVTIVEDVKLGMVAGSSLTLKISTKDEAGLTLTKEEVVKALSGFDASLQEPDNDDLTAIKLVDISDNGDILAKFSVVQAGINKISARYKGINLLCAVCSVTVFAGDVDVTKIAISTYETNTETSIPANSIYAIENIKKDPIFLMRFFDQFGNPRGPADGMDFKGILDVPKGARSKYILKSEVWPSTIKATKFALVDADLPFFKSELFNDQSSATFSALLKSGESQSVNIKIILKGNGNDDDVYTNDEIDPNASKITPGEIVATVGEFVTLIVELRSKNGKLYNHPDTFGWYADPVSSFKLEVDGKLPLNGGVTKGKSKGTYIITFTSYKSYINGADLAIYYQNTVGNTNLIPITYKVKIYFSPGPVSYMIAEDPSVFSDVPAGTKKAAVVIPFDKFDNLIPKLSLSALNLNVASSVYEAFTLGLSQNADGKVVFTYTPYKAGKLTITSLKFKSTERKTVASYSHMVLPADVNGAKTIATLDLDVISAGNFVQWKVYPRDAYDNAIDCSPAGLNAFKSTRQEPGTLDTLVLSNGNIQDEAIDYYFWNVTLTTAGTHEFKAFVGNALIPSNKYKVQVNPLDADFTKTNLGLYNSKSSVYDEYTKGLFEHDIAGYPDLKVILKDQFNNVVSQLPTKWDLKLYLTNTELGPKNGIAFCRQTDDVTFKMCSDNLLQPSLIAPSKRWYDLLVPKNYSLELENTLSPKRLFTLFLKGNSTEDDASNLPIEVQNTILTPDQLNTEAGVSASFQVYIMTTNPNLRRNEWFEDISIIQLQFAQDNGKVNYTVERGERKGIYKITVNSKISYVVNPNKINVTINSELVRNKFVKLFVNPGKPEVFYHFDKVTSRILADFPSFTVDDLFSRYFIARDVFDNMIDLADTTIGANSELKSPTGELISHTRNFPLDSEAVQIEFQPKVAGVYVITFNSKTSFKFEVKQGSFNYEKSSATLSPQKLVAGEKVKVVLTPRDKWGNLLVLSDVSKFQYFVNSPVDAEDSYTIGLSNGKIVNTSFVEFEQELTIKGFYKFRIAISTTPVFMGINRAQVVPGDVALSKCILKYLDDLTNKYVAASKDSIIKEDNVKYDPIYSLILSDKYGNIYDVFPTDLNDDFEVILYGNDYSISKPIRFLSNVIQGNALSITINPEDKIRYQSGIFEVTPYSLQVTYLTTKDKAIYPVQLLGEGDGDKDAEIEQPLDISKTFISKTGLKFIAGQSEDFLVELRTASGKRKADIGIPQFDFLFTQADNLNDGNFTATFTKGDLRGRFIVTVTGQKANEFAGPTLLSLKVNKLLVPKNLNVTVLPSDLNKIDVVQDTILASADKDYEFTVIPKDIYGNIAYVKPAALNLLIDFPTGVTGPKEYAGTPDYATNFIKFAVKSKYAGFYNILSQYLSTKKAFSVTAGIPSAKNTLVSVAPAIRRAGESFAVNVTLYDDNNNLISNINQDTLKYVNLVTILSGNPSVPSSGLASELKVNGNILQSTFVYNKVGSVNVLVNIQDKPAVCDTCNVKVIHNVLALNKTQFYLQRPEAQTVAVSVIDLPIGQTEFSLVSLLFDKYENPIIILPDNESFDSQLTGNNMESISFTAVRQDNSNLLDIVLVSKYSEAFSILVAADNYSLTLNYLIDGRAKESIGVRVDLNGDSGDGGNGPYVVENTVITPLQVALTAGYWGQFNVLLKTSENKRFVGRFNLQKLIASETPDSKGIEKLKFDYIYGEDRGYFAVREMTTKILNDSEFKTVQVSIDGKVLNKTVKVTVEPDAPDMAKTLITQPLPFDLYTRVASEIKFKVFDKMGNIFSSSDLCAKFYAQALEGKAEFSLVQFDAKTKEYKLSVTPIYPPRIVSIQLFYKNSANFNYPIMLNPFLSQILQTLDTTRTEIIGDKLPGINIGEDFYFHILLKDNEGYCFEPSRPLTVSLTGPYANSTVGDTKANNGDQIVKFNIEGVPIAPTVSTVEKILSNGYQCNKYYKVLSLGNQIQRVGYYEIQVFPKDSTTSYLKKRITLVKPGQVDLAKAQISLFGVSMTTSKLSLSIKTPITARLILKDTFRNNVVDNSKSNVVISVPSYSTSDISLKTVKSATSIDFTLIVSRIGNLPSPVFTLGNLTLSASQLTRVNFPDVIEIVPGNCSALQPNVLSKNLEDSGVGVGAKSNFLIQCLDEFRNLVGKGGATFTVQIIGNDVPTAGSEKINAVVTDKLDGSYQVDFASAWPGKYSVFIQLNGLQYGQSFTFTVIGSKCPADKPFTCPQNDQCVASYKDCGFEDLTCPSNDAPFKCLVNGETLCVKTQAECDCPSSDFTKCNSDKKCADIFNLDIICSTLGQYPDSINCIKDSSDSSVQCSDGSCRKSIDQCPSQPGCPPGHKLCVDLTCVLKTSECPDRGLESCPFEKYYRCDDYTCSLTPQGCPSRITCPKLGQIVCPDKKCVDSELLCALPPKCTAGSVVCPDASCASSYENCPSSIVCPTDLALCVDGSCKESCASAPSSRFRRLLQNDTQACASNKVTCPFGGECVDSREQCPTRVTCAAGEVKCSEFSCAKPSDCEHRKCPLSSVLCWDNTCADSLSECPTKTTCPSKYPVLCSDGNCVSNSTQCKASEACPSNRPIRCGSGECRKLFNECPTQKTCPLTHPIKCSDGSCVTNVENCIVKVEASRCPENLIRCGDGSCAVSKARCSTLSTCLPGQVRCWNMGCADTLGQCDYLSATDETCPSNFPVHCNDGSCTANIINCPTQTICPKDLPIKCDDGNCRGSLLDCSFNSACEPGYTRCPDGSCSSEACPSSVTCSTQSPYKCFDGTCRDHPESCPPMPVCTMDKVLCSDGSCQSSRNLCKPNPICPQTTPVLCPDLSCRLDVTECVSISKCPVGKVSCFDGSCVDSLAFCPKESCHADLPNRCNDGFCVSDASRCDLENGCPFNLPFKCGNGLCVKEKKVCPNDNIFFCSSKEDTLCPDGSCVQSAKNCPLANGCAANSPLRCSDGRCVNPNKTICALSKCPKEFSFKCYNGICLKSAKECSSLYVPEEDSHCLSNTDGNTIYCADGRCVSSLSECRPVFRCPPGHSRCGDGSCRLDKNQCPLVEEVCPAPNNKRCANGACVSSLDDCVLDNGCPASLPQKCEDSSICAKNITECPQVEANVILSNSCTFNKRYNCNGTCSSEPCYKNKIEPEACEKRNDSLTHRCDNGTCNYNHSSCSACPADQVKCSEGGKLFCRSSKDECLNIFNCPLKTPFKCADGSCVKPSEQQKCKPTIQCPLTTPYLCADGECEVNKESCRISLPCPVSKPFRCPDMSCSSSLTTCPSGCPPTAKIQCKNGACVDSVDECNIACPTDKPFRCATGDCVTSNFLCIDKSIRNGFKQSRLLIETAANIDSRCSADAPVFCSDGSCKSSCSIIPGCSDTSKPFRCNSGECVSVQTECVNDEGLGACASGNLRCADGICRVNCPAFMGCPLSTPFQCPSGHCSQDETGCRKDGGVLCADNISVDKASDCPSPVKTLKSETLKVTVSMFTQTFLSFIKDDETSSKFGSLFIPTGAFKNNSDISISPYTFVEVSGVADSELVNTTTKLKADLVKRIFPNTSLVNFSFVEVIRSPVVKIAVSGVNSTYNIPLVLGLGVTFFANSDFFDYCLGRLEGDEWVCKSRRQLGSKGEVSMGMFKYQLSQNGVYAVIYSPTLAPSKLNSAGTNDCDWWCDNKGAVLGSVFGFIAALIILAFVGYLYVRLTKKQGLEERLLENSGILLLFISFYL